MRYPGAPLAQPDARRPAQLHKAVILIWALLLSTACLLAPLPAVTPTSAPPTLPPPDTATPLSLGATSPPAASPTWVPTIVPAIATTAPAMPSSTPFTLAPTATSAQPPAAAPSATPIRASVPAVQDPIGLANASRLERVYTLPGPEGAQWKAGPDNRYIARVDEAVFPSVNVSVFALQTGLPQAHLEGISDFAISADNKLLAFTSENKTGLLDLATGAMKTVLDNQYGGAVIFSPDSRHLVSEENINVWVPVSSLMLWDTTTGKRLAQLDRGIADDAFAFSPDSRLLAGSTDTTTVTLWDATTGAVRATISSGQPATSTESYVDLLFSPDSALLAVRAADQIALWRVPSGTQQAVFKAPVEFDNNVSGDVSLGYFETIAFSPDGRLLASVLKDHTVQVWNVQTGAAQAVLTGHQDRIDRVAFSPDSRRLATAGEESDSTVRLWDAQTGAAILADQDHQAGLYAMRPRSFAFSPDGALFAATSQFIPVAGSPQVGTEGILLWDAQTGQVQATVPQPVGDERTQLLFSPDGRLLAYTMDGDSPAHVAGVVNVYGLISGNTPRAGLTLSGSPPLAFKAAVPQTWLAADPIPARYQVDFKNDYETFLTCPYTGNNQVIYEVEVVTVTVTDLKTSQQVAQQTFRGSDSAQCNSVEDFPVGGGKSKYVTSDATADQFTQWFTSTMTPLMP